MKFRAFKSCDATALPRRACSQVISQRQTSKLCLKKSKIAHSELSWATLQNRSLVHSHSCEKECNVHVNEISFSYKRMSTETHFEKEAKDNSEMAYESMSQGVNTIWTVKLLLARFFLPSYPLHSLHERPLPSIHLDCANSRDNGVHDINTLINNFGDFWS